MFPGLLAPLLCMGCVSAWWNSFLDPSQVGNFRDNTVNEIQQSISFRDTPLGVPGAVDPTPEDLVQTVEEYQLGVGDMLSVRILDFLSRDTESEFQPTVDELGYIHIPNLNELHVEGMTVRELRAEIVQRAKNAGIFRAEAQPTVVITFLQQQQRSYSIGGTVAAAGRYRIVPPDFRLRDAVNQAGGIDPSIKTIYVFRNEPKPKRVRERGVHQSVETGNRSADEQMPAPPVSPVSLAEMAGAPNPPSAPSAVASKPVATRPTSASLSLPGEESSRELLDAVAPVQRAPASRQSSPEVTPAAPAPALPPFIYINDKFIEGTAAPAPGAAQPAARSKAPDAPTASRPVAASEPVDWQELAPSGAHRIIRISAEKLMNGEPSSNVVIEPNDFIRMDAGQVGVFYLMGHVSRPGVYSLTGQQITLRQAIAAAGGLDTLAWPTRCEITRRIDGEREEITQWDLARIMEGKDPDLFLKPEDVVNVGTHAIAPLLATIRNSFRLTYGFGFVYDRNFADIDSFYGQQNPTDRRRTVLQQRFPGLFP